ncbi:MAG: hypothetical protein IPI46_06655 [Bacteroidetes bacterium]|nr:hypothetical protein [Bacteroidota bacterium]
MQKQTLLFLGSKPIGYHCLLYLLQNRELLQIEIVGLMTNDNPVFSKSLSLKSLANEYQIPLIDHLDDIPKADYIYSVQYHEILKAHHIAKAKKIAVNLHMAPLPEYRGCNQFSFAIVDEKKEFGTTIHKIHTGIDDGDILFEQRFPIPENCWVAELYQLTYEASLILFKTSISKLLKGDFTPASQNDLRFQRSTSIHYRNEINNLKKIDLNWDQEKIDRHIRATYMPGFEPPYTLLGNEKIYFTKSWK